MKKITKYLLIIIAVYFAAGLVLVRLELIQNLYFFPGYKIQYGKEPDTDTSTFSCDGPIVIYKDGKAICYAITPENNRLVKQVIKIGRTDTLSCFVEETQQSFRFCLKDSLEIPPSEYALPEKMLIVSDIEGNFKGFYSI